MTHHLTIQKTPTLAVESDRRRADFGAARVVGVEVMLTCDECSMVEELCNHHPEVLA